MGRALMAFAPIGQSATPRGRAEWQCARQILAALGDFPARYAIERPRRRP